ncbi:hypothetical protein [Bacillus mycoides]|uniref:hypothetical protein n=1 Tax=Bacillus mycoides TaxID=1405 RepID=UPI003D65647B
MAKYKFIASLHDFEIKQVLNKGIVIKDNIRISNSSNKVSEIIDRTFSDAIGGLELTCIETMPYFYAVGDCEEENVFQDSKVGLEFLGYFLLCTQYFNSLLWLIKDNSVNIENGFLRLQSSRKIKCHSNSRTGAFFNSKGKREVTEFTPEEINAIVKFSQYFFNPLHTEEVESTKEASLEAFKGDRIERFFYFLQAARVESYLPNRISTFVTLLETLLSTSSTEVTHKLKERLAWILGENFEERKEIFDTMGVIYKIRSANVHGNTMPKQGNSLEKLEKLSMTVEEYARKLILKIINDEDIRGLYRGVGERVDKKIENWLNELVLGKQ